jgi:threonine dehydratase
LRKDAYDPVQPRRSQRCRCAGAPDRAADAELGLALLARRIGATVVVKHENHTPTGAFKVRGGLVYMDSLRRAGKLPKGVVTATRGNHGQSVALAASKFGVSSILVVPEGNSIEKNAAMEVLGGALVIAGRDFEESRGKAAEIERERGYHYIPSFHADLVRGVATASLELFSDYADLEALYVPIGMGSGICAAIAARDLLGLKTEVIGVVAENAPAIALSFEAGKPVPTSTARTFADGLACRDPQPDALAIIAKGAARILRVTEDEIAEAIRLYYTATHNMAEGAGAAALAALIQERDQQKGRRIGVILSGGNIDMTVFARVLAGETPRV